MKSNALQADGTMRLEDGRKLTLYPATQTEANHIQEEAGSTPMAEEDCRFFLENAFFFVAHAEEILSDSRMFLAPVPVHASLRPTLGIYLELWMHTGKTIVLDEESRLLLYWFISGSPLSGSNACMVVDEAGHAEKRPVDYYVGLECSFRRLCGRYAACKQVGQAYTLHQVKELLVAKDKANGASNYLDKAYRNALTWYAKGMSKRYEGLWNEVKSLRDICHQMTLDAQQQRNMENWDARADELMPIMATYFEKEEQAHAQIADWQAELQKLRSKVRHGEIANTDFQPCFMELKKMIEEERRYPMEYLRDALAQLSPAVECQEPFDDLCDWYQLRLKHE